MTLALSFWNSILLLAIFLRPPFLPLLPLLYRSLDWLSTLLTLSVTILMGSAMMLMVLWKKMHQWMVVLTRRTMLIWNDLAPRTIQNAQGSGVVSSLIAKTTEELNGTHRDCSTPKPVNKKQNGNMCLRFYEVATFS